MLHTIHKGMISLALGVTQEMIQSAKLHNTTERVMTSHCA